MTMAAPDAFEQTTITDEQAFADAAFKDTDGNPTRVLEALDKTGAKARVIEIFGTWCPNYADALRELVSLKASTATISASSAWRLKSPRISSDRRPVQRHHEHIGSDWRCSSRV
ncbi:MAG: hypothetical protein R3B67_10085 [Phycisphaerales bacterium]